MYKAIPFIQDQNPNTLVVMVSLSVTNLTNVSKDNTKLFADINTQHICPLSHFIRPLRFYVKLPRELAL